MIFHYDVKSYLYINCNYNRHLCSNTVDVLWELNTNYTWNLANLFLTNFIVVWVSKHKKTIELSVQVTKLTDKYVQRYKSTDLT